MFALRGESGDGILGRKLCGDGNMYGVVASILDGMRMRRMLKGLKW